MFMFSGLMKVREEQEATVNEGNMNRRACVCLFAYIMYQMFFDICLQFSFSRAITDKHQ